MSKPSQSPQRRVLHFKSLDDIIADVRPMVGTQPTGTGGWTPGQIVEHVSIGIERSTNGFDFVAPLPLRIFGRLSKNHYLKKGFPSGIKLRSKMADTFLPKDNLDFDEAVERLIKAIERAKEKKMTAASPMFGQLTHEQWIQFQCRHAELHFSFIKPAQA